MLPSQSPAIFTVSHLDRTVRLLLEREMGQVWISGEISNFSQPSSGHWYFTLKDDNAQVRCTMFRNSNHRVMFRPQHGQQALVRANITLCEPRGDYQIIIESIQPAGEGLLQRKYEQLKVQLTAEGLFEQKHGRALPLPTHCVGVTTSKTGVALCGILHVPRCHDPGLPVIIYPIAVQGNGAPEQILRAIALANAHQERDMLIVGRGDGSLEDLWSFDDERTARAIFASRIPIINAVGHETDVTTADFVADLQAPAPSAATEIVSRNQQELLCQLQSGQQRPEMAMDYFLTSHQRRSAQLFHRLQQQHPQLCLAHQQIVLGHLRQRMCITMESQFKRAEQRRRHAVQRLDHYNSQPQIHWAQSRTQQLEYRLAESMRSRLSKRHERFGNAVTHLEAVDPLAILIHGYSVTSVSDSTVLKRTEQVKTGDLLTAHLKDGWVESEVKQIAPVKRTRARKPSPTEPAE